MSDKKKFIELDDWEQYFFNSSLLGDEIVIGIAKVEDKGRVLNKEHVKMALKYMCKRHPLLRAHIIKNNETKKIFCGIEDEDQFDYDRITVEWSTLESGENLTSELEKFNDRLFNYDESCLLWRTKLIDFEEDGVFKHVIAFVLPLFLTDGINHTVLCMELLNILNCILNGTECKEMIEKRDVISGLKQYIEKYNLFTEKQREAVEYRLKHNKNVNFNFPYKFKNLKEKESGLKMRLLSVEKELTIKIVKHAKENKIKLNGLLIAASYYALKMLYEEQNTFMPRDVSCYIPINLRMRLNPKIDFSDIRLGIASARLNLLYPDFGKYEDIWKDAEYINKIVSEKARFDNGEILEIQYDSGMLNGANKLFEDSKDINEIATKINLCCDCDLAISNIGTYPFDNREIVEGPLKLTEYYFGDSLNSNPNTFVPLILHICTWDQRLMIQLSSNRRIFSSSCSERFMSYLHTVLRNSV